MEINVVDIGDPGLQKPILQLNNWHKKIIEMTTGPNGVQLMVEAVIKLAKDPGTIDVLRIYAHGNAGVINIAGGEVDAQDELSAIGPKSLPKLMPILQSLMPYFAGKARVELLGCHVAEGKGGEAVLLKLAKIWNTPVQASTKPLPMGAVQFQGGVVQANPQGGLCSVAGTEMKKN